MGLALPCLDKYGRKGQDISMLTQTRIRYDFTDDIPFKIVFLYQSCKQITRNMPQN